MNESQTFPAAVFNKLSMVLQDLRWLLPERAAELARIAGRPPMSVSQMENEQAKRELAGERDAERQHLLLEREAGPTLAAPMGVFVARLRSLKSGPTSRRDQAKTLRSTP